MYFYVFGKRKRVYDEFKLSNTCMDYLFGTYTMNYNNITLSIAMLLHTNNK